MFAFSGASISEPASFKNERARSRALWWREAGRGATGDGPAGKAFRGLHHEVTAEETQPHVPLGWQAGRRVQRPRGGMLRGSDAWGSRQALGRGTALFLLVGESPPLTRLAVKRGGLGTVSARLAVS